MPLFDCSPCQERQHLLPCQEQSCHHLYQGQPLILDLFPQLPDRKTFTRWLYLRTVYVLLHRSKLLTHFLGWCSWVLTAFKMHRLFTFNNYCPIVRRKCMLYVQNVSKNKGLCETYRQSIIEKYVSLYETYSLSIANADQLQCERIGYEWGLTAVIYLMILVNPSSSPWGFSQRELYKDRFKNCCLFLTIANCAKFPSPISRRWWNIPNNVLLHFKPQRTVLKIQYWVTCLSWA